MHVNINSGIHHYVGTHVSLSGALLILVSLRTGYLDGRNNNNQGIL